jgi:hypothetical protein
MGPAVATGVVTSGAVEPPDQAGVDLGPELCPPLSFGGAVDDATSERGDSGRMVAGQVIGHSSALSEGRLFSIYRSGRGGG